MGTTLPWNGKDGEISLSRLGEKKVSFLESVKNNCIFQKFDETEWDGGEESLKKSLYPLKNSGRQLFLLENPWWILVIWDPTKKGSIWTYIF